MASLACFGYVRAKFPQCPPHHIRFVRPGRCLNTTCECLLCGSATSVDLFRGPLHQPTPCLRSVRSIWLRRWLWSAVVAVRCVRTDGRTCAHRNWCRGRAALHQTTLCGGCTTQGCATHWRGSTTPCWLQKRCKRNTTAAAAAAAAGHNSKPPTKPAAVHRARTYTDTQDACWRERKLYSTSVSDMLLLCVRIGCFNAGSAHPACRVEYRESEA